MMKTTTSLGLLVVAVAFSSAPSATGFQLTKTKGWNTFPELSVARSDCRSPKASFLVRSQTPTSLRSSIQTNDEVKDPSTLISAQDDQTQQTSFILISSGILAGSIVFLNLYNFLEVVLPPAIFDPFYTVLPYVLSSAFISAGIAHFAVEDTFTSICSTKRKLGRLVAGSFSWIRGTWFDLRTISFLLVRHCRGSRWKLVDSSHRYYKWTSHW